MQLYKALESVAVLGAAGKMGKGISCLLLQEMARIEASQKGEIAPGGRRLLLVDARTDFSFELKQYLGRHLEQYAEKSIVLLRRYYATNANLISNEQIIHAFVEGALELVSYSHNIADALGSTLIFEAIAEDVNAKVDALKMVASPQSFYMSNTSSIPISILNKKASLQGRLVGFHFYNPPHVQKLIELISPQDVTREARQLAVDLATSLDKVLVESADVAGFIGNGYFAREIIFACNQVKELAKTIPLEEGIYLINRITQEYLVRPMGIFQLIDYVGLDVCQRVLQTMQTYLHDEQFQDSLIDKMVDLGAFGGQLVDGSQKDGFFRYEHHTITGVFSVNKRLYRSFHEGQWVNDIKNVLGPLPDNWNPWKKLYRNSDPEKHIVHYFETLFDQKTPGSEVAVDFLLKSRSIAEQLVADGVAQNMEDVNTVLRYGFYHLYGADIPWFDHAGLIKGKICDI